MNINFVLFTYIPFQTMISVEGGVKLDYPTKLDLILKDANEVIKDYNFDTSSAPIEELILRVEKCNKMNKVMKETLVKLEEMEVSIFDKSKHEIILNSFKNMTKNIGQINEIVSKNPLKFSSDEVKELIKKIKF